MRLVYTCSSCKKANYLKPKMDTRAQLQMKFGEMVRVSCSNCAKMEKKHLNKISATADNRLVVGGFISGILLIFIIGSYLEIMAQLNISFWKVLVIAGSTIAGIPMFLWDRENKAVRNFNKYAIKKT